MLRFVFRLFLALMLAPLLAAVFLCRLSWHGIRKVPNWPAILSVLVLAHCLALGAWHVLGPFSLQPKKKPFPPRADGAAKDYEWYFSENALSKAPERGRAETYDYKEALTVIRPKLGQLVLLDRYFDHVYAVRKTGGRDATDPLGAESRLRIFFTHYPSNSKANPWFYVYLESQYFNGRPDRVADLLKEFEINEGAIVSNHLRREDRPVGEGFGYVRVRKTPGVHVRWPLPMKYERFQCITRDLANWWYQNVKAEVKLNF